MNFEKNPDSRDSGSHDPDVPTFAIASTSPVTSRNSSRRPANSNADRANHAVPETENDSTARALETLKQSGVKCLVFESAPEFDSRWLVEVVQRTITGGIDLMIFRSVAAFEETICAANASGFGSRFIDALCDIEMLVTEDGLVEAAAAIGVSAQLLDIEKCSGQPWRRLLQALDSRIPLLNRAVGLEVCPDFRFISEGLAARGADVFSLDPFIPAGRTAGDMALVEAISAGQLSGLTFTSAASVCHLLFQFDEKFGDGSLPESQSSILPQNQHARLQHMLEEITVTGTDKTICDFASARLGIPVMAINELPANGDPARLTSNRLSLPRNQHQSSSSINRRPMSSTDPAVPADSELPPWHNSPFMKACRGEETDVTPIWMMRQAGRYMEEYREVRAKVSFLELCANPGLCSEVMCTAVERLGVDAAIIFSDLLPILVPMGCDLEFVKGDGPKIHNPVRTAADIDRIKPLENNDELMFVMETVAQTRKDLPADLPLIGFAGAPFTLASYMIEGGASRNYANTKQLMFGDPAAWNQLMEHLTHSISIYLNGQVEAGAQCLQIFDSWAGCLSAPDYAELVLPYVQKIIASIPKHVPVINFATGNPALLPLLAEASPQVVGVDWRTGLDQAWATVGHKFSVQGNLDPTVLLTNRAEIRKQAKRVLDEAAGRPGHIFNLGHGILPQTPVENAIALVESVHELSAK